MAQAVDAFEGSRSLLLVNFRPEYEAEWTHRGHYQQLPLVPLRPEAVRELVVSLLGSDPSVRELPQRIERWTGGNPFFTEEVIQTLFEGGQLEGSPGAYRLAADLERLEVPSSVQAVLAARIDRLPELAKQVLWTAAVIGKGFSGPLLEAVTDVPQTELAGALERLKTGDFVYERALYPTAEYAFKHPLSHEVAYESQLKERRARTHARVAQAIEAREADHLDERAALIAYHWEEAGELARAVDWHQRAAMWAGLNDAPESIRHWERVRNLVAELPPDPETLSVGAQACARMLLLRWRIGSSERDATRLFEDGKALAEQGENVAVLAELHGAYAAMRGLNMGYADDYVTYGLEATRLAGETDDEALKCTMAQWLSWAYFWSGRAQEACALAEEVLARMPDDIHFGAEFSAGHPPRLALLGAKGAALVHMGCFAEARGHLEALTEPTITNAFPEVAVTSFARLCRLASLQGDGTASLRYARATLDWAEKLGGSFHRVWAYLALGYAHLANREWNEATDALRRVLATANTIHSSVHFTGTALGGLAEAFLGHGKIQEATQHALEGTAFDRFHGLASDFQPWLALVSSHTAAGEESAAREALAEAQQRIHKSRGRAYQPLLHERRADFAHRFGDPSTRKDELRKAQRLFTEMGATGHAARVARELSDLE